MKRITKLGCSAITIFLLISFTDSNAQDGSIREVFEWSAETDKEGLFEFENYDCDLTIRTWDKPQVSYRMKVDAQFRNNADALKLKEHLEELEMEGSSSHRFFKNRFWSSRKNIAGIKTIKLSGNGTLVYKELKITGEIWIPADLSLKLISKYSSITMDELSGRLDLDLYSDKLEGKDVLNNVNIKAKYSNIDLMKLGDLDAVIYDSDLTFEDIEDASITSKYSKIICKNAGKLKIDSYDDNFNFESTGDINIKAKYTDLKAGVTGKLLIDYYDGTIEAGECTDVDLTSKYTKFTLGKSNNWLIRSSYDDSFIADLVNDISITESKYTKYVVSSLDNSLELITGYDDKITISTVNEGFEKISLNGKYVKSEFGFFEDASYRIKANLKYPHLDLNEESLKVRLKILESSQLEYEAIKGNESEGMPLINITGYDMTLKINN